LGEPNTPSIYYIHFRYDIVSWPHRLMSTAQLILNNGHFDHISISLTKEETNTLIIIHSSLKWQYFCGKMGLCLRSQCIILKLWCSFGCNDGFRRSICPKSITNELDRSLVFFMVQNWSFRTAFVSRYAPYEQRN
jgi:hypothetical protein